MPDAAALFCPPDAAEARAASAACCGPCALAAALGKTVADVRAFFPRAPRSRPVTPHHMRAALDAAGVRHGRGVRFLDSRSCWPQRGLAFVQVDGPWCSPEVPVTVAYRHTHWVGVVGEWVYDANAGEWLPEGEWRAEVVPRLLAAVRRSTGWWVRTAIELPEEQ